MQLLLLTLDEGYLLTATPSDLERGKAPLRPSCDDDNAATAPWRWGCSSRPQPLALGVGWLLPASAPNLVDGVGYGFSSGHVWM